MSAKDCKYVAAEGAKESVRLAKYALMAIVTSPTTLEQCTPPGVDGAPITLETEDDSLLKKMWILCSNAIDKAKEMHDYSSWDRDKFETMAVGQAFAVPSVISSVPAGPASKYETLALADSFYRAQRICRQIFELFANEEFQYPDIRREYYNALRFGGLNQLGTVRQVMWKMDGSQRPERSGDEPLSDFTFGAGFYQYLATSNQHNCLGGRNLPVGKDWVVPVMTLAYSVLSLAPILYSEMVASAAQVKPQGRRQRVESTPMVEDINLIAGIEGIQPELGNLLTLTLKATTGTVTPQMEKDLGLGIPEMKPFDVFPFYGLTRA